MPETEDKLRLSLMAYPFPEIKRVEEVFSTLKADAALLEEAKRRGFYMGHTKANQMFWRVLNDNIQSAEVGDATPQEALTAAQEQATEILAEYQ